MSIALPPRRTLAALLTLAASAACITVPGAVRVSDEQYRQATAGAIGCPAEEIVLSGQRHEIAIGEALAAYQATCRGRRFVCTPAKDRAVCTEELPPAAPKGATP